MNQADDARERMILRNLLRESRARSGLRQTDVANALGIPQSVISKYESGERRIDLVELRKLCAVFGMRLSELISEFEKLSETYQ